MSLLVGTALALGMRQQMAVATTADRGKGRYLYRACQALDHVNAIPPGEKPDAEEVGWARECSGYIDGWLDALLDGSGELEQRGVCLHEWTVPEVGHLYVVYLEKHKDLMNTESGLALKLALHERFPCKKK